MSRASTARTTKTCAGSWEPDVAETFAYKVRDRGGKLLEGTLEADSQQLLIGKLRSMGYMPIDIQQQNQASMSKELNIPFLSTG